MNPLTRQLFPSPTLGRWRWRSPEGPASSCRAGRTWSLQECSSSSSTLEQHAPLLHPAQSIQENTEVYWGLLNYTREYWGILNQETTGVQTPSLVLGILEYTELYYISPWPLWRRVAQSPLPVPQSTDDTVQWQSLPPVECAQQLRGSHMTITWPSHDCYVTKLQHTALS